jgi:hypothetical protein
MCGLIFCTFFVWYLSHSQDKWETFGKKMLIGFHVKSLYSSPVLTLWRLGGRTSPITSKRCILYIYSTTIVTEYFKHGIYSLNEQRKILHEIIKRKAKWICHILRRNCLLKQVIEGKIKGEIEVIRRQGRRRKKLLDDLKDRNGFCEMKEEALDLSFDKLLMMMMMIYCLFSSLQNTVCFIILTYLVPVLFTFYIQSVLKLKKLIPAPKG